MQPSEEIVCILVDVVIFRSQFIYNISVQIYNHATLHITHRGLTLLTSYLPNIVQNVPKIYN